MVRESEGWQEREREREWWDSLSPLPVFSMKGREREGERDEGPPPPLPLPSLPRDRRGASESMGDALTLTQAAARCKCVRACVREREFVCLCRLSPLTFWEHLRSTGSGLTLAPPAWRTEKLKKLLITQRNRPTHRLICLVHG